ncbi:succinyl-diaminopimelate desuccinylase [Agaricicola taiwanensis]|uniref:Succinyl-diaminopimelate desuccinylase n=1 Tax=Agaricicola taiwanensis TaxID=591372 RepID=A0A8J2VNB4_9RHOB|nr:succinyl-diaminopimelate desuccinylase [Agaricicola taiwanensis]GGE33432.1 succinyl-diaminopimelate desuccinylase [Agaricicola taiwanensis]
MAGEVNVLTLARDLLRCASVTPDEGGAIALLASVLEQAGFSVHRPVFSAPDTPDVENLYARIGTEGPVLVLAGHTDVVPPGDEAGWTHPPFSGDVSDGKLWGRGAVDMKGGVAAMVAAALSQVRKGPFQGSIVFLITGDEEGPAINGTKKLLSWAQEKGERFDHCLLGEPTSVGAMGDTLKIGRRGSCTGRLTIHGKQGHVAYPEKTQNPIRAALPVLAALMQPLDEGNEHFQPSNLEVVSVDVGNPASNVIPASVTALFNARFNDLHTLTSLEALLRARVAKAAGGIPFELTFASSNSEAFLTAPGPFVDLLQKAVEAETGRMPQLSTGGGTSDARFIKDYCPVVELGLVGTTMHQADEHVPVDELEALTRLYSRILELYFSG